MSGLTHFDGREHDPLAVFAHLPDRHGFQRKWVNFELGSLEFEDSV
jgi:hypothetical protein